jgi:hypothetical protein
MPEMSVLLRNRSRLAATLTACLLTTSACDGGGGSSKKGVDASTVRPDASGGDTLDAGRTLDAATGGPAPGQAEVPAVVRAEIEKRFETCVLPEELTAFTTEALNAAKEAFANGERNIALTSTGCTRLILETKAGHVTSETLIAAPYTTIFVNEPTFQVLFTARMSTWSFPDDASESFAQDRDGDGFLEIRGTTTYGKQTVIEQYAPDGSLLGRQTSKAVDTESNVETLSELFVDGKLADSLTRVSSRFQSSCRDPVNGEPPPANPPKQDPPKERTCSADEKKAIQTAMDEAMRSVMTCLTALHPGTADTIVKQYMGPGYRVHCGALHEDRLAITITNGDGVFSGPVDIYLDPSALFGAERANLASTLFHEMMHTNDDHDPIANNAAGYDNLKLVDPIYACEQVCFGTSVNECHLAACLGEKLSETWVDRSGKLRTCSGRARVPADLDGMGFGGLLGVPYNFSAGKSGYVGSCSSGHQVGALCRSVKGSATQEAQFCTTESECNEVCDGDCESFSLSCDKSCR